MIYLPDMIEDGLVFLFLMDKFELRLYYKQKEMWVLVSSSREAPRWHSGCVWKGRHLAKASSTFIWTEHCTCSMLAIVGAYTTINCTWDKRPTFFFLVQCSASQVHLHCRCPYNFVFPRCILPTSLPVGAIAVHSSGPAWTLHTRVANYR